MLPGRLATLDPRENPALLVLLARKAKKGKQAPPAPKVTQVQPPP